MSRAAPVFAALYYRLVEGEALPCLQVKGKLAQVGERATEHLGRLAIGVGLAVLAARFPRGRRSRRRGDL